MKYSKLGQTDIEVSQICLGTMTWGEQNTEKEAHEQLDYAIEAGINFIDVAEMYPVPPRAETYGLTESYVGNWLSKRKDRDKIILATKVSAKAEWLPYIRNCQIKPSILSRLQPMSEIIDASRKFIFESLSFTYTKNSLSLQVIR